MNFTELRPNQRNVIEGYASGKDVFFCSPTGSRKPLTFGIAPFVLSYLKTKPHCLVYVVLLFPLLFREVRGFKPHQRHCSVSLSKNINPSLALVQPRKTRPFIIERLLMGRKESNQTKQMKHHILFFPKIKKDVTKIYGLLLS